MSPIDKVRIIVFAMYAFTIVIVYWRLIPRLLPAGRFLVTIMLAAQVIALVMATVVHPEDNSSIIGLWHLDRERNIPTVFATTQLATVGGLTLLVAWFSRAQSKWQALCFVGLALLFFFLASDEFHEHRSIIRAMPGGVAVMYVLYVSLGAVVIGGAALLTVTSPRSKRIWPICFALGLALGGAGSLGLDTYLLGSESSCRLLDLWNNDECKLYMVEESLEKLGIWLTLVAVLGQLAVVSPSPRLFVRLAIYAMPLLALGILIASFPPLHHRIKGLPLELHFLYRTQRINVEYAEVDLRGYRIDFHDDSLDVILVAVVTDWHEYSDWGYSLHLVDQLTGESVAGTNRAGRRKDSFKIGKHHLYRQRFNVQIPTGTERDRALWVVLTSWREEDGAFIKQKVISTELQVWNESQVILGELTI